MSKGLVHVLIHSVVARIPNFVVVGKQVAQKLHKNKAQFMILLFEKLMAYFFDCKYWWIRLSSRIAYAALHEVYKCL